MAFKDNAVELEERVVAINRVTKVVKGGRNMRFAALVVVGDRNGRVGFGTGKSQEVPEAIRKAVEAAKKNLIEVPMVGTTIPHEVRSEFGGAKVLLKQAVEGAGKNGDGHQKRIFPFSGAVVGGGKMVRCAVGFWGKAHQNEGEAYPPIQKACFSCGRAGGCGGGGGGMRHLECAGKSG